MMHHSIQVFCMWKAKAAFWDWEVNVDDAICCSILHFCSYISMWCYRKFQDISICICMETRSVKMFGFGLYKIYILLPTVYIVWNYGHTVSSIWLYSNCISKNISKNMDTWHDTKTWSFQSMLVGCGNPQ